LRSQQYNKNKKLVTGMTLIEVLVALFILSTGILGAVAMQASAKKGSFDAMQRSMASAMAQDIVERMRGNDARVGTSVLNSYVGTYNNPDFTIPSDAIRCNTPANICTSNELVTNDLNEWQLSLVGADVKNSTDNNGGLVGATGCIAENNNAVTVVISWEGRTETSDGASDTTCGSVSTKRRQIVVNAFIL